MIALNMPEKLAYLQILAEFTKLFKKAVIRIILLSAETWTMNLQLCVYLLSFYTCMGEISDFGSIKNCKDAYTRTCFFLIDTWSNVFFLICDICHRLIFLWIYLPYDNSWANLTNCPKEKLIKTGT